MKSLSHMSQLIDGQPMFQILDKAQKLEREGRDILHFELGEPDFDTPGNIIEAACHSLNSGETHYTNSMGAYEFRNEIREATLQSRGFEPDLEQVLVTPGANSIIYLAVRCLVDPGMDVIVPDPGFPTYYSVIKMCGVNAIRVPLYEKNQFRLSPDDLEDRITENTRLIIINSPSNPTGAAMTATEIEAVAKIAEKYDIYILSDEIYARLLFDENKQFRSPSCLDMCRERTIIINGFSKAFAMTGWRLGVAIGPSDVIAKMGLMVQTVVSCVPPFIQAAGKEALSGDQSQLRDMHMQYKKRRDILVNGLNEIDGISCILPDGAIYAFPNITGTGMSSNEFANFILDEAGVALLPGNNFGEYGHGYVRMCYVNSVDNINLALSRINNALKGIK